MSDAPLLQALPSPIPGVKRMLVRDASGQQVEVVETGPTRAARLPQGGVFAPFQQEGQRIVLGRPLARRLVDLAPPPTVALGMVSAILRDLATLHAQGGAHGALDPEGVGFDTAGRLVVRACLHVAPRPGTLAEADVAAVGRLVDALLPRPPEGVEWTRLPYWLRGLGVGTDRIGFPDARAANQAWMAVLGRRDLDRETEAWMASRGLRLPTPARGFAVRAVAAGAPRANALARDKAAADARAWVLKELDQQRAERYRRLTAQAEAKARAEVDALIADRGTRDVATFERAVAVEVQRIEAERREREAARRREALVRADAARREAEVQRSQRLADARAVAALVEVRHDADETLEAIGAEADDEPESALPAAVLVGMPGAHGGPPFEGEGADEPRAGEEPADESMDAEVTDPGVGLGDLGPGEPELVEPPSADADADADPDRGAEEPDRAMRSSAAFDPATLSASGDGGGRGGAPERPDADDNGASDAEERRAEAGGDARTGEPDPEAIAGEDAGTAAEPEETPWSSPVLERVSSSASGDEPEDADGRLAQPEHLPDELLLPGDGAGPEAGADTTDDALGAPGEAIDAAPPDAEDGGAPGEDERRADPAPDDAVGESPLDATDDIADEPEAEADVLPLDPAGSAREPDPTPQSSAVFEQATLSAAGDGGERGEAPERSGSDDSGGPDAEKSRAETDGDAGIGEPSLPERAEPVQPRSATTGADLDRTDHAAPTAAPQDWGPEHTVIAPRGVPTPPLDATISADGAPRWSGAVGITGDQARAAEKGPGKWVESGRSPAELRAQLPPGSSRPVNLEEPQRSGPPGWVLLVGAVLLVVGLVTALVNLAAP